MAWATARAQDPGELDAYVAERALGAANRVFRIYCGDPQWPARIRAQTSGYGQTARPPIELPTSNGDAEHANGHDPLRLPR